MIPGIMQAIMQRNTAILIVIPMSRKKNPARIALACVMGKGLDVPQRGGDNSYGWRNHIGDAFISRQANVTSK